MEQVYYLIEVYEDIDRGKSDFRFAGYYTSIYKRKRNGNAKRDRLPSEGIPAGKRAGTPGPAGDAGVCAKL